jgi:hypothetical protein
MAMGRHSHSGAREVVVIAQREIEREEKEEEVIGILTNGATLRWSCKDGHTTTLNRETW